MENTIKALDFISGCSLNESNEGIITIGIDELSDLLVAYAATISPAAEVVVRVPSRMRITRGSTKVYRQTATAWNLCLEKLEEINPTLTFTDETKSK